ncbi:MAG: hypothetical protein EA398_07990 [Deltaproteobacteria bacterium]|nr:MAG: hypothetical protein EA398_07990 [Deltaproteobacteria bacterium]
MDTKREPVMPGQTFGAELVLLGRPVAHSVSPAFQTAGLRACDLGWRYRAVLADEATVERAFAAMESDDLVGANVTLPWKGLAARGRFAPSDSVVRTGAANTLWRDGQGACRTANTDVYGVRASLHALGIREGDPVEAVVLGGGGAAAAAISCCRGYRLPVRVVVRRPRAVTAILAQDLVEEVDVRCWDASALDDLRGSLLVIDATSLAHQDPRVASRAYRVLGLAKPMADSRWLSLSYSRERLSFEKLALQAGAPCLDGRVMLLHQGAVSFELWTGLEAPLQVMASALDSATNAIASGRMPTEPIHEAVRAGVEAERFLARGS